MWYPSNEMLWKICAAMATLLVGLVIIYGTLQAESVYNAPYAVPPATVEVEPEVEDPCVYYYQMELGKWRTDGTGEGETRLIQRKASCEGEVLLLDEEASIACPWLSEEAAAELVEIHRPAVYEDEIIRWPCTWRGES